MALLWEDDDDDNPDSARGLGLSLLPARGDLRSVHPHGPGRRLTLSERALAWLIFAWLFGLTVAALVGWVS